MRTDAAFRALVAAALRRQGLRLADVDERGWYAVCLVQGEAVKVWATDAPEVRA
jgi:hypothetical protein